MKPLIRIAKLIVCAVAVLGFGESLQAQSKAVKEAEKLADHRQYAEAVRTLELAMLEGDTSEILLLDLADYYKKIGNLRMATALCKPLVDKQRPRPWHLLEVASMLVDQGRFTDAEPYLQRFEEMKPEDRRVDMLRARIQAHVAIRAQYPGARLDTFLHNTLADEGFPFVHDSQIYWSSDREGSKRTSGWTGRPMVGLYTARLEPEHGYTAAERLDTRFNSGTINVASPCLSANGDTLFFTANAEEPNRHGDRNMQLYYAVRKGSEWKQPTRIPTQPEDPLCLHPSLSHDGRYLYYASDAATSRGGLDLYRIERRGQGEWGAPENLGPTINTERHDGFPVAASNGKLYFASQGHPGLGGFDLFMTQERADGSWTSPINLGEPVNSEYDETAWVEIRRGFSLLVSKRTGGDDDIYEVRW